MFFTLWQRMQRHSRAQPPSSEAHEMRCVSVHFDGPSRLHHLHAFMLASHCSVLKKETERSSSHQPATWPHHDILKCGAVVRLLPTSLQVTSQRLHAVRTLTFALHLELSVANRTELSDMKHAVSQIQVWRVTTDV